MYTDRPRYAHLLKYTPLLLEGY